MATVITFGQQKGGVGKTTTCSMAAYTLSQTHKVLAIDMDSQGSLTQLLSQRSVYEFTGKTILQGIRNMDACKYVVPLTKNLSIIPAEDELATLSRIIYDEQISPTPGLVLDRAIRGIKKDYDYILIDQPPALDELSINAMAASDFVVAVLLSEQLCLTALDRYLKALQEVQKRYNPDLRLAGILVALSDSRILSDQAVVSQARNDYGTVVFNAEIKRKSRIKEYPMIGIQSSTKADRDAQEPYIAFVKELLNRVQ